MLERKRLSIDKQKRIDIKAAHLTFKMVRLKSFIEFCVGLSFTFWENQSGGRPDSENGLMALLTDTLEDEEILHIKYELKTGQAESKCV